MDLTQKTFKLTYRESKVEEFFGIKKILPKGYEPKIKIVITKVN
jgi:hypothetical protein